MYKPFKKLYFWIKSKVSEMITKENFKILKEKNALLFKAACDAILDNQISEFVEKDFQYENELLSYSIGLDKFTVYSSLDIGHHTIYFETFYWKKIPTQDNKCEKIHIPETDIICFDDSLKISSMKKDIEHTRNGDHYAMVELFKHYFNDVRKFIENYHKTKVEKIKNFPGNNY